MIEMAALFLIRLSMSPSLNFQNLVGSSHVKVAFVDIRGAKGF